MLLSSFGECDEYCCDHAVSVWYEFCHNAVSAWGGMSAAVIML